jgi:sentrin-specific protease 7
LWTDRTIDHQSHQKNLQKKFESYKVSDALRLQAQQREKFLKYQTEDHKEEILALDNDLPDNFQYKFQYMQGNRTKEIEVKLYDLQKLNPPNYLNDTIINFYLK